MSAVGRKLPYTERPKTAQNGQKRSLSPGGLRLTDTPALRIWKRKNSLLLSPLAWRRLAAKRSSCLRSRSSPSQLQLSH